MGGVKALAESSAENESFFTCSLRRQLRHPVQERRDILLGVRGVGVLMRSYILSGRVRGMKGACSRPGGGAKCSPGDKREGGQRRNMEDLSFTGKWIIFGITNPDSGGFKIKRK